MPPLRCDLDFGSNLAQAMQYDISGRTHGFFHPALLEWAEVAVGRERSPP